MSREKVGLQNAKPLRIHLKQSGYKCIGDFYNKVISYNSVYFVCVVQYLYVILYQMNKHSN